MQMTKLTLLGEWNIRIVSVDFFFSLSKRKKWPVWDSLDVRLRVCAGPWQVGVGWLVEVKTRPKPCLSTSNYLYWVESRMGVFTPFAFQESLRYRFRLRSAL